MTHISYYLIIQSGYAVFGLLLFVAGWWKNPSREIFLKRAFILSLVFHAIFLIASLIYHYTGFQALWQEPIYTFVSTPR